MWTTNTQFPNPSNTLLRLPREIRDLTYDLMAKTSLKDLESLVRCSKEIYLEAISFLYQVLKVNIQNIDILRYGMGITRTKPSDMLKPNQKGRWFQSSSIKKKQKQNQVQSILELNTEKRKIHLFGQVKSIIFGDQESIMGICSIICQYQYKPKSSQVPLKDLKRVFDKVKTLTFLAEATNSINNIIHGKTGKYNRNIYKVIFQHFVSGINPHSLIIESPAWIRLRSPDSQKLPSNKSFYLLEYFIKYWDLFNITLLNVVGKEFTHSPSPFLYPRFKPENLSVIFAPIKWIKYPWYHYAIENWIIYDNGIGRTPNPAIHYPTKKAVQKIMENGMINLLKLIYASDASEDPVTIPIRAQIHSQTCIFPKGVVSWLDKITKDIHIQERLKRDVSFYIRPKGRYAGIA